MKTLQTIIIFTILLLLSIPAHAADITFAWDPNIETDLAGYRLYQSDKSDEYRFGADHCMAEIPAGTETVILQLVPDGTWFYVLTAFDQWGNESGPSNEVMITIDSIAPAPPRSLRLSSVLSKIQIGKDQLLLSYRRNVKNEP